MRLNHLLIGCLSMILTSAAKDLGIISTVLEIKERSLLEVIQERLSMLQQDGSLHQHHQKIQKRAVASIERPQAVAGLGQVTTPYVKRYDPSITVQEDLKDHKGRIFARKGETYNPLKDTPFGQPLLFIDGDDERQISLALTHPGKTVLVKGAPLKLARQYQKPFYFDQGGRLVQKLKITEVPARVSQKGDILLIEMVALNHLTDGN